MYFSAAAVGMFNALCPFFLNISNYVILKGNCMYVCM